MELKEFISETLIQIAEGVTDAQKRLRDAGSAAIINTNMTETSDGHLVTGGRRRPVEFVDFDVAVTASNENEKKAGGGIVVASLLKIEAGGKSNQSTGSESRIKFKIPMSFPMHVWESAENT